MSGSFGYELDFGKLSYEEKDSVKKQIEYFKKYEEFIHTGLYYRLSNPFSDAFAAWEMTSEDKNEVLINVVLLEIHGNQQPIYVKLKGLEEGTMYESETTGDLYSSDALMHVGMPFVPEMTEYQSWQIKLVKK